MKNHPIHLACALFSLTVVLGTTSACDKKDDKAKQKQEQKQAQAYIDKIVDQVDEICACASRECAESASKELTKIQDEAEAKIDGWPSSEVHARLLPEMKRAGRCHAANI